MSPSAAYPGCIHCSPLERPVPGPGADHGLDRVERQHRLGRDDTVFGHVERVRRVAHALCQEHGVHGPAAAGDPVRAPVFDESGDVTGLSLALVEAGCGGHACTPPG